MLRVDDTEAVDEREGYLDESAVIGRDASHGCHNSLAHE
jgi:hypothetical protein